MKAKLPAENGIVDSRAELAVASVFWISLLLLLAVPLVFSTSVHRIFALPRFAVLILGSAVLAGLFPFCSRSNSGAGSFRTIAQSRLFILVSAYLISIIVSTILGAEPIASVLGSYQNQMGLVTQLCFFICFVGLLLGTGGSKSRLAAVLWTMVVTGLIVSCYGLAQFFGLDPFLDPKLYTYQGSSGPVLRIISTIGHADYLGNFLLYTTLLSLAVGLAFGGRKRRIALAGFAVSAVAIAASGTRGAWLGLAVGAALFAILEIRHGMLVIQRAPRKRLALASALLIVSASVLISTMAAGGASGSIVARIRSFAGEGMTGSGRTILWRDALRMIPAYPVVGCGPEGFRRAFLPFKSRALAHNSPETNNESSHNSYIDAAVSYGLPGAVLYVGIIAAMIQLVFSARRYAASRSSDRLVLSGIMASIAAVATHNFFIFDQISTGLYFFALAALAQIVNHVNVGQELLPSGGIEAAGSVEKARRSDGQRRRGSNAEQMPTKSYSRALRRAAVAITGPALIVASIWYATGSLRSDAEIKAAFESGRAGDLQALVRHGEAAAAAPDPTGSFNFLYATALVSYLGRIDPNSPGGNTETAAPTRSKLIDTAAERAKKSLAHSLAPDSSYVVLAYLALLRRDKQALNEYGSMAVKSDPNFTNSHWLMGEAYLADGDYEKAEEEAMTALDLNGSSSQAVSLLKRARGKGQVEEPSADETLSQARTDIARGNFERARRLISRAIARSRDGCVACHREMAALYEAQGFYESAVAEWRYVASLAHDPAAQQEASRQIEALTAKISQSSKNGIVTR